MTITTRRARAWVDRYVHAWSTADPQDIEALFTEDAEYHERPYTTSWVGRDAIVRGWLSREPWQEGGWTFEADVMMVTGDTAAIRGTGVYKKLGTFENLWVITFDPHGVCTEFRMWNNEVS
ncbi:nuclear transport factor 2 family protein [Streptomyces sp. NPDC059863]|uniref:nuclear transport factor 2 family protein n=1 Tax=unclassified Streptomyces TaxID=2593676 RepID=UPI003655F3F5